MQSSPARESDRGHDQTAGLTVISVLYGGVETLRETLPTWVSAARGTGTSFIFVDNSPTDEASMVVDEQVWDASSVRIIRRPDNPGFAAASNIAASQAQTDWVLLLNPDVHLTSIALRRILEFTDAAARRKSYEPAAVSLITRGVRTTGIYLDRLGYFSDRPASSSAVILGPSGGAAVFPRSVFLDLGGFHEDHFAWGEDAGLAVRLYASGRRTHELDLGLHHVGGHSVSDLAGQRRKAHLLARNRVLILRTHFSLPFRATMGLLQLLLMVANGVRKVRLGTARQHFAGMREGLSAPCGPRSAEYLTVRSFIGYRRNRPAKLVCTA